MIRCDAKSSSSGAARWRGPSRGNAPPSRPPTCTAPSCSGAPGAGSLRHGRIHRHHSPGARTARGVHRSHRPEPRGGRSAGAERAAAPDTAHQRRDPLRGPAVRHRRPEAPPRRAALRAPDPTGPRDETVHILTFTDGGERPVALLWSYACHPVTFAEPWQVSADYPGVVRRALRAAFGADLPVLFLQGCAGDIRPRELGRPRTLGRRLAERVVGKLFTPFTAPEYVAWSGSLATQVVEVARGRATSYPLAPAAAETRLRLSALLAGASPDQHLTTQPLPVVPGRSVTG